jgi:hypothetical protein
MELKKWMVKAISAGKALADSHPGYCYERALDDLSLDELEPLQEQDFKYDAFFRAGFVGREPEYVEAIRYGDIPDCGRSINHADNCYEDGVSCVKIIRTADDINYQSIYDVTLGYQGFKKTVVAGWYLGGSGSDGEPLLLCAQKIND